MFYVCMQITGEDGIQGTFKVYYAGATFSVMFYYILGASGGHEFSVGPPSEGGISMTAAQPTIAGGIMTCTLNAVNA